ncbi:protein kinase domain-containing protein [Streptomyces ziwulingensis]|uniref:Protein kinase domain-containing protein n=1 Tax=Streptomyces ziwulingensis TaxID=1045501 RepID=A0ABP9BT61_9ACTN
MPSALLHDDPDVVGPYRTLARLGSGGMGTVYLARTAGGRTVAVKVLHRRLASDAALRTRFRLEADAARVIGGRYGAAVHDADPSAPLPWLATEYVVGPPLDDAVRAGGPLPEPAVRAIGLALAEGLAQLHRSEVVHRDLKPSNVMVTTTGVKIIDFGVARAVGEEHLTRFGGALGTPAFMSPEQAADLEHGAPGDVFALAGVLVYAASGHGPFGSGQATDLLYRVRHTEPDLGGVPPALVPVVARCLAKDPARRPTTGELAAALADGTRPHRPAVLLADVLPDAVLREIARRADAVWGEPPRRLPPPPPDLAPQPPAVTAPGMSRRRLFGVTAGAVAAGAGLAGGGVWAWLAARDTPDGGDDGENAARVVKAPARLWTMPVHISAGRADVLPAGTGLAVPAGILLSGANAESGEATWQANLADGWRYTGDGTALYALRDPDEGDALAVCGIDTADGTLGEPLAELGGLAGDEPRNQILRVDKKVAYLTARAASGDAWYLLAVGLDDGRERWRAPIDAARQVNLPPLLCGAVAGDRLVTYRADSETSFLSLAVRAVADGKEHWSQTTPYDGPAPAEIVHDERHLYFGSSGLEAVRISDGGTGWIFGNGRDAGDSAGETRLYGAPVVRDGVVYCTEGDRGVVSVDAATGTLNWLEKGLAGRGLVRDEAPAVGEKYVYSLDDKGLRAVDLSTRRAVWTYPTDATVLTADSERGRLYVREEKETFALPLA